jgi:hypothetical protein
MTRHLRLKIAVRPTDSQSAAISEVVATYFLLRAAASQRAHFSIGLGRHEPHDESNSKAGAVDIVTVPTRTRVFFAANDRADVQLEIRDQAGRRDRVAG